MTYNDLKKMLDEGKTPLVRFTERIHKIESQFEKDMLAEVIGIKINDAETYCRIIVSEEKYKAYNKAIERRIWYDINKKEQCGKYSDESLRKDICSIHDNPLNIQLFVLNDGNIDIFNEFLESGENSYIEWLEEQLSFYKTLNN